MYFINPLMIEKHDIQPSMIYFLFALFNHLLAAIEMTSRTFSYYSVYCRWRLHLCCNYNFLYVFQTNNSFNMLSNLIKRFTLSYSWKSIIFDKVMYSHTIIIVDLRNYVQKNYMHTFQLKCRIIYLPQLQILMLVYYFLKWRQDLMR